MLLDELSRATGLGFLVSQAPILVFLMMYYTEPHATLYTTRMSNGTLVDVQSDEYGTATVYMLVSAVGVSFSFMTAQLEQVGTVDNMVEYTDDLMSTLHVWNAVTWAVAFLTHGIVVAQVCTPVNTYFLALTVIGITYTVQCMCAPGRRRSDSLSLIVFMILAGTVYSEMHAKHGLRLVAFTALAMADVVLVVGHAFDANSNMETIANTRVFYCSFSIVLLLVLYSA
jgi:hypothetical protein